MSFTLTLFGLLVPWLILGLFIAVGAWIGFQLIQQNGRLLSRLESLEARLGRLPVAPPAPAPAVPQQPLPVPSAPQGLPAGSLAPAFELPDLSGGKKALADFRGRELLLIFFNPRCGFCTRMAEPLAVLPVDGAAGAPLPLLVSTGEVEENRKLAAHHGIRCPILMQDQMEVGALYHCHGTPMGYLIDAQGRIASGMAVGADALLALARRSAPGAASPDPSDGNGAGPLGGTRTLAESKIQRNGLTAGTPAPSFRLPRLDGGELSLEEYRGRRVLLVFSDPKCGPCDALAPRLEEAHRRSGDAQVLMVSRGEVEANQAKVEQHGLTFPIGLQKQWEISREYAMFATPVGYLIDEHGIIAAEVASGAEAILALLAGATRKAPERRCKCGKLQSECGRGGCGCAREKVPAATA